MRAGLDLSATLLLTPFLLMGSRPLSSQVILTSGSSPCSDTIGTFLPNGLYLLNGPYTATIRSTNEQRLADGNIIRTSSETTQARDSVGRFMQANARVCERSADSAVGERTMVSVSDPKAGISLTWTQGPRSTHVAYLRHTPERKADAVRMRPPQIETFPRRTDTRSDQINEQLGTRTIAGLEATGVRWTRIIPAGAEGNDLPLKIVRETWSSRNPRGIVMSIDDDPRTGHHVAELTALSLSEPDPSVFAPPQGYTIDEDKPIETHAGTNTSAGSTTATITPPR